ncbi:MAG: hypothetical protein ACKVQJ_05805 [Pyrinomonadaceae bacterium]
MPGLSGTRWGNAKEKGRLFRQPRLFISGILPKVLTSATVVATSATTIVTASTTAIVVTSAPAAPNPTPKRSRKP